jgi:hypothetical protein
MAKDKRTPYEILFDRSGEPQPGDVEAARAAFLDDPASPWHKENPKGTPRKNK